MMQQERSILTRYKDAVQFAQELPPRPVYSVKDVAKHLHERTIRRRIKKLTEIGLAQYNRGKFTIKREVVAQPIIVLEQLIPSFIALTQARRFGKSYRQSDINFMMKNLPENSTITLDYSAHKMTKFQSAHDLYVYVDDIEKTAHFLKKIILEKEQKEILYFFQKQVHLKIQQNEYFWIVLQKEEEI